MHSPSLSSLLTFALLTCCGLQSLPAADPLRGLWVGEVALTAVNEATGAVGDSNTYEFTDPELLTPTADTAYIRLIVHVNGAGQASLLKSVAIIDRNLTDVDNEVVDLLLLTDPALYSQFPGPAKRIASAAFDFGDPEAIQAVEALIDDATELAVSGALAGDDQATIQADIETALGALVTNADVDSAYLDRGTSASSFLTDDFFDYAAIELLASTTASLLDSGARTAADFAYDPAAPTYEPYAGEAFAGTFDAVFDAAETLRDSSFYGDTRGIEATVQVVEAAVAGVEASDPAADLATKEAAALAAAEAAWHNAGDLDQIYNRFLASAAFDQLPAALISVAVSAAIDAEALGGDAAAISTAVRDALLLNGEVAAANTAAADVALASVFSEADPRATRVMEDLIDTAVDAATTQALLDPTLAVMSEQVGSAVEAAVEEVPTSPVLARSPSAQYTDYVSGDDYADAAATAAARAAAEASFLYGAGETDEARLSYLVRREVNQSLVASRNDVAALPQDRVTLKGRFADGEALHGILYLPALAPTNPFMHRLHPDHPEGFPIVRHIELAIDSSAEGGDFASSGFGVSRIAGIYTEEVTGLHKALGENQDIGLKTQGIFTLNRLSLIDTLNF